MSTIFFTHIPKTAGTSIRKSVFDKNIPKTRKHLYSGMRAALTNSNGFKILQAIIPMAYINCIGFRIQNIT